MDRVTEKEIMRGVRLTAVQAERFKTGLLSVSFLTPHTRKNASMCAVLPYVLRRGTARLPDMESIAAALDDLYGARIEPSLRRKGEVTALGFTADFPDGAFLPGRLDTLSGAAGLMGELILSPVTRGGRLRQDFVESERQNLIDDINAEINDKRSYAARRLCEVMFRGEPYGVSRLGSLRDAERVSVAGLTRFYRELIASAPVEVFYCGAESAARVEMAVREALASLPRANVLPMPVTPLSPPWDGSARRVTERMDVTQGRLLMGFDLSAAMDTPDYAAMSVFNAAFGGGVTGRLFMEVRERLALCYYVNSTVDRHKGALFVSAGIGFDRYDDAVREITGQLEAIANGELTDWEVESARRAVVSSLISALDEPSGLEGLYFDRALLGARARPREMAALAAAVTAEDIAAVARAARLKCVYFLTAEGEDA